jgi:hypothetical protein
MIKGWLVLVTEPVPSLTSALVRRTGFASNGLRYHWPLETVPMMQGVETDS